MSEFVTKDNVHEATDIPRIRSLMTNAERLGAEDVVLLCRDRLSELAADTIIGKHRNTHARIYQLNTNIEKIDLGYWLDKNPYYGTTTPLPKSIKTAKTKLKKHLAIEFDFNFCGEITAAIETKRQHYIDSPSKDLAIEIFDLIMLWGGSEGVKLTKNSFYRSVRKNIDAWLPFYTKFIDELLSPSSGTVDPIYALRQFGPIKGVGMSFSTKHLRWWGSYPIYDNRIGLLLYCASNISTINEGSLSLYSKYLSDISKLSNKHNLTPLEVEKALFGFSQNYFPNSNLDLVKAPPRTDQIEIAIRISEEAQI
jgi:hypothetical protein